MHPRNQRVILLNQISHNMHTIRKALAASIKIMAVVKADAYGHGAEEVSKTVLSAGADMLAVASVSEGVYLRKKGIDAPILVLGAVTEEDVQEGVEWNLIQTVCSPRMVQLCEKAAQMLGKVAEIHLKIDTGMGRIGVRTMEERNDVLEETEKSDQICLSGVFTHFSDADDGLEGDQYTEEQYQRFLNMTADLPKGIIRHCSNSAAIHKKPECSLDLVRVGISMYGYPPVSQNLSLKPCMRWTAKISYIKELPSGCYISYGRKYVTKKNTRIATVTCGYADGYHRNAGSCAEVLIHGKRAKIVGRICMDQMMADISDIPEALPEDEVVLMGEDGNEQITAEDIANWSDTICYEILLSAGSRVERIYDWEKESL